MAVAEKAQRLARNGAVRDLIVTDELLSANVVGDSDTWKVSRNPDGWRCTCPAYSLGHKMCSHIGAVGLYEKWGPIYEAELRARQRMSRRDRREDHEDPSRPSDRVR